MRTGITVVGCLALLMAGLPGTAAAESASREEHMGVGAGLVIGALAGGPFGAIIGAAAGARLGDSYHQRREESDRLAVALSGEREAVAALQQDVNALRQDNDALDRELRKLNDIARPELLALLRAGLELDLLFRTDEDAVADSTADRIRSLAATLASMDDVQVRIDGYSDERGDAAYNLELSERRAKSVRDLLVDAGMPVDRVQVAAHGESVVANPTADNYALERRVQVTVFVPDQATVAASP